MADEGRVVAADNRPAALRQAIAQILGVGLDDMLGDLMD